MFATASATLTDLTVTSEATFSAKLTGYDAIIQNSLKSLGDTFLGKTNVAGDLTVDGTLSFTGSSINSIGGDCRVASAPRNDVIASPQSGEAISNTCGSLFVQNSPLAQAVDFFNGLVTIGKDGLLTAQKIIAKEVEADQLTISDKTAGTGVLTAGTTEIPVFNNLTKSDSIIILTPETVTNTQLIVSDKVEGSGFVVKVAGPQIQNINFSYIIVGRKEAANK